MYLWFLFLVPILIITHFYFFKKSKSKAIIFSNAQALKRMVKGSIFSANFTHLVLRCLIIICLITAASGATLWVLDESSNVNIIFALDSSASMSSPDVGESRFESAKDIISKIASDAPRANNYALLTFAGVTQIRQPFTNERAELNIALNQADISRIGGTDISSAIITATNLFELKPEEGKMLILLSDGLDNSNSFISQSLDEVSQYARDNQVVIHSIAIGSEGGPLGFLPEYYQISSMFDDKVVLTLANETEGTYSKIESFADIPNVIQSLEMESSKSFVNYNLFYWAFITVFILLTIEWVVANTIFRRVL